MSLSQNKLAVVTRIFASAPDDALRRLESLLASAHAGEPKLEAVHSLAAAESSARRVVAAVFEPLLPLTAHATAPKRQLVRRDQLNLAWRRVVEAEPDLVERISWVARTPRGDEDPPADYDIAAAAAAELMMGDERELAELLRLTPVLRRAVPRLAGWTRNLSGENVAGIRLAFKDALAIDENSGPLFWEVIFSLLEEPWQVVRLISAAIDRPSDRYLASSELASLGERLLDDVDERIAALKRFDPAGGAACGLAQAESVMTAFQMISEFEEWLALKKDGPWGQRTSEQKRALAMCMEARLRETEPAVAAALPTQPMRGAGRNVRPQPKLSAEPQAALVARADALLTLMEVARGAATAGGFGALRAKTVEALEKRLQQYCDDLLDLLHKGEIEPEELDRVRTFLEIGARFIGLVQGPQAAQILRRRAAAAG